MSRENRVKGLWCSLQLKVRKTATPRVHSTAPDWTGLGFGLEKVLKETVRRLDGDEQYCVGAEQ